MLVRWVPCDSIQEDQASGPLTVNFLDSQPLANTPFPFSLSLKDKTDHRTIGP